MDPRSRSEEKGEPLYLRIALKFIRPRGPELDPLKPGQTVQKGEGGLAKNNPYPGENFFGKNPFKIFLPRTVDHFPAGGVFLNLRQNSGGNTIFRQGKNDERTFSFHILRDYREFPVQSRFRVSLQGIGVYFQLPEKYQDRRDFNLKVESNLWFAVE
jgi:hypothetical protein